MNRREHIRSLEINIFVILLSDGLIRNDYHDATVGNTNIISIMQFLLDFTLHLHSFYSDPFAVINLN